MFQDKTANAFHIIQIQQRHLGFDPGIARHGDDVRIVGMKQRLAGLGAPDLELGYRGKLEAFDEEQWFRFGGGTRF